MAHAYVLWPGGKEIPPGWEKVDMIVKKIPEEPGLNSIKARITARKLRSIVMGDQVTGLEELAALEHRQWAEWVRFMFCHVTNNGDGSVTLPPELVGRWKRLMRTSYKDLEEDEKESDRAQARKVLSFSWLQEEGHATL